MASLQSGENNVGQLQASGVARSSGGDHAHQPTGSSGDLKPEGKVMRYDDDESHALTRALENMRQFAECADDCIVILDRSLRIRYLNVCASRFFDIRPDHVIGKSFNDLFPFTHEDILKRLHVTLSTCSSFSFEDRITLNGGAIWLDTRCSPIRSETGAVIALLCLSRDVTERKLREQQITRSKEDWLRAVDNLPHLLAVVSKDYRIERVNTNMAEQLGITTQKAAGTICFKRLHGMSKPPSYCPLSKSLADDMNYAIEVQDRHLGCDSISLSSFRDKAGKIGGCIYVGRLTLTDAARGQTERCIKSLMRKVDFILRIQDTGGRYLFLTAIVSGNLHHADVVGKTPYDFFEPAMASKMVDRIGKAIAGRKGFTEACEVRWKGETFHFLDQISPIRNAEGNVDLVATVSKKVAETKRAGDPRPVLAEGINKLSPREREILELIAHGLSVKEIADRLFISVKTVETHRARIMQKLDLHKTTGLVSFAVTSGLL
ncbi:MAG: PAS domain-containing protein [Syntrophobacteraceae bacterium]